MCVFRIYWKKKISRRKRRRKHRKRKKKKRENNKRISSIIIRFRFLPQRKIETRERHKSRRNTIENIRKKMHVQQGHCNILGLFIYLSYIHLCFSLCSTQNFSWFLLMRYLRSLIISSEFVCFVFREDVKYLCACVGINECCATQVKIWISMHTKCKKKKNECRTVASSTHIFKITSTLK